MKPPFERSIRKVGVRRVGKPEDIAAACAFFVSEKAGYITGQILGVNGGRNTWPLNTHSPKEIDVREGPDLHRESTVTS